MLQEGIIPSFVSLLVPLPCLLTVSPDALTPLSKFNNFVVKSSFPRRGKPYRTKMFTSQHLSKEAKMFTSKHLSKGKTNKVCSSFISRMLITVSIRTRAFPRRLYAKRKTLCFTVALSPLSYRIR